MIRKPWGWEAKKQAGAWGLQNPNERTCDPLGVTGILKPSDPIDPIANMNIPDNSAIFCVNEDRNCLIDQNGQKIAGDRARQVFVSREGTCVFPNKLNSGLQYPDGQPVEFASVAGQRFYPMTIELNVPHQLYPTEAARQQR